MQENIQKIVRKESNLKNDYQNNPFKSISIKGDNDNSNNNSE